MDLSDSLSYLEEQFISFYPKPEESNFKGPIFFL
jgi:hypothetical protein